MNRVIFRLIFLSISMLSILFANIDNKITSTKKSLQDKNLHEKIISNKLSQIARKILVEEEKLSNINKKILSTKQKIKKENAKTHIKQGELKKIQTLYDKLFSRKKSVNKELTNLLTKSISLEMITSDNSKPADKSFSDRSVDNIVMQEIYKTYRKILKVKFEKSKKRYLKLEKNLTIVKSELDSLKLKLKRLKKEIKTYDKLKSMKKKSIRILDSQRSAYLTKLNHIKSEKSLLNKTLAKLKITKMEKDKTRITSSPTITSIRQIGSSYQSEKIARYTGPKTIAPLTSYTIAQNFGTYTDPIYKMKIFNDSVILKSKKRNARVKNVLDGKVIYADKTSVLENVVIVKNSNNIHTIYAHLSQIAPTIRVGKKIKKGYIIGRINKELTFEVTQNEKHINPLKLIK